MRGDVKKQAKDVAVHRPKWRSKPKAALRGGRLSFRGGRGRGGQGGEATGSYGKLWEATGSYGKLREATGSYGKLREA